MVRDEGPDGPRSWAIAVACCFLNMMVFGMFRLQGMLFVASMPRYGVDRQQASFPYIVSSFVRGIISPLVGYIGHRLGVRLVTTFGCLLCAIGIATCFLAESIQTVTIFWGVIYGLGFGLGNILLPITINQYFDKHRATASGISFSGACLGSFILPPIFDILLATYGLSGTFLILAGFVLHCVPVAVLLRKPVFVIKPTKRQIDQKGNILENKRHRITFIKKVGHHTLENSTDFRIIHSEMPHEIKYPNPISIMNAPQTCEVPIPTISSNYSTNLRMSNPEPLYFKEILHNNKGRSQVDHTYMDCDSSILDSYKSDRDVVVATLPDVDGVKSLVSCRSFIKRLSNGTLPSKNYDIQYPKSFNDTYVNHAYLPDNDEDTEKKRHSESLKESSRSSAFSIIFDPIFVLIAIINSIYRFTFVFMMTIIVDFAHDINVGESNEKYVLMSLSVGDLVGRLSLGWVTDDGYMTKTGFATFCFMFQGVVTTATAWTTGFVSLVIVATLYGLSEAGLIIIFPLIVAEFIDEDKQTVAISSCNFLTGPLCLAVAPLIGYFRDEIGSYDFIFYGIGLLSVLCSAPCLFIPRLVKYRRKV